MHVLRKCESIDMCIRIYIVPWCNVYMRIHIHRYIIHILHFVHVFPECVAKGSCFLGRESWGGALFAGRCGLLRVVAGRKSLITSPLCL